MREMTPDEMSGPDWAAYMRGEVRVNFAENKPLPVKDPTNGLVDHWLSEPWRGGCDGDSTNPNCQVGTSGVVTWDRVHSYLKEGNWTRGSVIAWPKAEATAVPTNTPVATSTPVKTSTPVPAGSGTATATPTVTATPGGVGEVPSEGEIQAALQPEETPRKSGFAFWAWCCGSLFIIAAVLILAFWKKIRKYLADDGFWPYSDEELAALNEARRAALAEQPADPAMAPAEEPEDETPDWMNPGESPERDVPPLTIRRRN